MKWTFHPKTKEITTSLPLSVEITEWVGHPVVLIKEIGVLDLRPRGAVLKTDFYLTLPGKYTLVVKDGEESFTKDILVEQHTYLDFKNEFGIFFILFLIVMGGIVLWTRKIMSKKTRPT